MENQKRVLVVEDIKDTRDTYLEILEAAGYSSNGVGNLRDAITTIERVTYHVAVVDITLDVNDDSNRDGMSVIKHLHDLNEGTECIILSAQKSVDVAVDAYEKFGLTRYLEKAKLKRTEDLVVAVQMAFERCRIRDHGSYETLTGFLARERDPRAWENRCLSVLKPAGGIEGLTSFFNQLCRPLNPLLRRIDSKSILQVSQDASLVSGDVWSKGTGQSIRMIAYSRRVQPTGVVSPESNKGITRCEVADIVGLVEPLDMPRESFITRME